MFSCALVKYDINILSLAKLVLPQEPTFQIYNFMKYSNDDSVLTNVS